MPEDEVDGELDGYEEPTELDPNEIVDPETGEPVVEDPEEVVEPVVAAAEPVAEPAPVRREPSKSPYSADWMTEKDKEDSALLFDTQQLDFVQRLVRAEVQRDRIAYAQQRQESTSLGLTNEFMAEYGADIERMAPYVPENLKGTKEGVLLAAQIAVAQRAAQDGTDYKKEIARCNRLLNGEPKPAPAPPAKPAAPAPARAIPPAAVVSRPSVSGAAPVGQRSGVTRAEHRMNRLLANLGGVDK